MTRGFLEKLIDRIQRVQPDDVQSYLIDLAREKGFLETIFNAILEGVIVTDLKGRILYLNKAACAFFGLQGGTQLGRPLGEAVRGLDWSSLQSSIHEVVNREMEVFYPENRLLNFYVVGLLGGEGEGQQLEGHAIILRDITQTRRSTEETIESERLSALTLLAAGVAHEIGNPLNSLGIHLQLLQRRTKKLPRKYQADFEESLEVAAQEVTRLDGIITQFLRAVRPQPVAMIPENLNTILQESLDFLAPEIRDRDLLVETELDPGLPLINLDRDQIKQAFYNILRNSFQAMSTGGFLTVQTHHDETHVFVAFSDTGGGIPAEQINRIFEPYFSTKPGGSGLGLMIVQRIVRAHGGEIALHSTAGQGLTFSLRFPRLDRSVRLLGPGSPK
jgi:two-component system, sporulation sensor kinase E